MSVKILIEYIEKKTIILKDDGVRQLAKHDPELHFSVALENKPIATLRSCHTAKTRI